MDVRGTRRPNDRAILTALPFPVLVITSDDQVEHANPAAENFFAISAGKLATRRLDELVSFDSPLIAGVAQVRRRRAPVFDHSITLQGPRLPACAVNVQAALIDERSDDVVICIEPISTAQRLDRHLQHRDAARSIEGLAAVLAHEVKNPLAGIRGAAQLLEQGVPAADRQLTRLIRDETDRICALIDRFEVFSEPRLVRANVNVHEVLERVRDIAKAGFARSITIEEVYDPSLPAVFANRDQLIQVFLNLIKNAAEAKAGRGDGRIVLRTAFRHGVWLDTGGGRERVHVPLEIAIRDNGVGISDEIQAAVFNPFVTTKSNGSGLGLTLVAKIVGDHGGTVEFETGAEGTEFRVHLPVIQEN